MILQLIGHFREIAEQAGESRPPGLDDRIVDRHHIERHITVVCVDDGLYRVAHIVEAGPGQTALLEPVVLGALRVRVLVGGRVRVDHIVDAAVENHGVHIAVVLQERCELLHPISHIAHVDHAGVVVDEVGYQRLDLTEPQRKCHLADDPAQFDASRAAVVAQHVAAVVGDIVDLVDGCADQGVSIHVLAVVDLRNPEIQIERVVDVVGDRRHQEVRATLVGRGVGTRHRQAVAVGDAHMSALPVGGVLPGELTGAEHHLPQFTVDHIPVCVEGGFQRSGSRQCIFTEEPIEAAFCLEPFKGGMNCNRVEYSGVLNRYGIGADLLGREYLGVVERGDGHVLETERVAGGFDVAIGEIRLSCGLVGVDLEALHKRRVDPADHNRHERPEPDSEHR